MNVKEANVKEAGFIPQNKANISNMPFPEMWMSWLNGLNKQVARNYLPLSGDVSQWIDAWGQSFGQVGLFNVNLINSKSPATEKEISSKYSYGRQLGRILDVLVPLVKENGERLADEGKLNDEDLHDFLDMAQDIYSTKMKTTSSINSMLDTIQMVRGDFPSHYQQKFDQIINILHELQPLEHSHT
jgi:hypothetical protein